MMRTPNTGNDNFVRKSKQLIEPVKYFIVTEGAVTEQKYFTGIKELFINGSLIEIVPVEPESEEIARSNPLLRIDDFEKSIIDGRINDYIKGRDKVCFVMDRDKKSFKESQYTDFICKCKEKDYFPYITNPYFELFLLMHDERFLSLSEEELKKDKKQGKHTFIINELSKMFGSAYSKNKKTIQFSEFKDKLEIAIKNERHFCEDVDKLKDELGSNVGLLLDEFLKNK